MHQTLLNKLPDYTTSLPFNACALDRIPLQQPGNEELFTVWETGDIKVQVTCSAYFMFLDNLKEEPTSAELIAVAKILIRKFEEGSTHYDVKNYEDLVVKELYKPEKFSLKKFFSKSKKKEHQQSKRCWIVSIQDLLLRRIFPSQEAHCSILHIPTGTYLQHVSYYRHYTSLPLAMDTTVVAAGQKICYCLRPNC